MLHSYAKKFFQCSLVISIIREIVLLTLIPIQLGIPDLSVIVKGNKLILFFFQFNTHSIRHLSSGFKIICLSLLFMSCNCLHFSFLQPRFIANHHCGKNHFLSCIRYAVLIRHLVHGQPGASLWCRYMMYYASCTYYRPLQDRIVINIVLFKVNAKLFLNSKKNNIIY